MTKLYGWTSSNGLNIIDDISCVAPTTYDGVTNSCIAVAQCAYWVQEASQRVSTSKHDEHPQPHRLGHVFHPLMLMLAARSNH